MRWKLLYCIFILGLSTMMQVNAQPVKFDKLISKCEYKWVLMPIKYFDSFYAYSYVWTEPSGTEFIFKFHLLDLCYVGKDGNMKRIGRPINGTHYTHYFIKDSIKTQKFYILPASKYAQLGITKKLTDSLLATRYSMYDSGSADFNRKKGIFYNYLGEYAIALQYLQKAEKLDPENSSAYSMAMSYNGLKQYNKALPLAEAVVKKNPKDEFSYLELVKAQLGLGKVAEAETNANICIALSANGYYKKPVIFELISYYYSKKDKVNFEKWMTALKAWENGYADDYLKKAEEMEKQLG